MINFLKKLNPWRQPTPTEVMEKMAYESAVNLLAQEASASYHKKMAEYHAENLARIQKRLNPVAFLEMDKSSLH